VDTVAPLIDHPGATVRTYEAETAVNPSCDAAANPYCVSVSTGGKYNGQDGPGWNIWANGTLSAGFPLALEGQLRIRIRAKQQAFGTEPARMALLVNGLAVRTFDVPNTAYAEFEFVTAALPVGTQSLGVRFTNDAGDGAGGDRNLMVDRFSVEGPLGAPTGTVRREAALAGVDSLYRRMLFRPASAAEQEAGLVLMGDIQSLNLSVQSAWSGLCEALFRHPDFLFTLAPSHETASGAVRDALILARMAQDLLARPPDAAELARLASGEDTLDSLAEAYVDSPEFRARFFEKMRIRTESDGTPDSDEPARLWTWLLTAERPLEELLTADYGMDAAGQPVARPAHHGRTGVLTMRGFMQNKPGLPGYNFPARVMTDFMGTIFEIPEEVFEQRGTSTASSTVDPSSACYSCHRVLTPLAHQRLRWTNAGDYREVDDQGLAIDDSDRGLVSDYPFKGQGLEAFSTVAVKKEAFRRRTLNAVHAFATGREMRADTDERGLYRELWDLSLASDGNLREVLLHILKSPAYRRQPAP
jgi:hypothetical protein